jgi:hypothetical protein
MLLLQQTEYSLAIGDPFIKAISMAHARGGSAALCHSTMFNRVLNRLSITTIYLVNRVLLLTLGRFN